MRGCVIAEVSLPRCIQLFYSDTKNKGIEVII